LAPQWFLETWESSKIGAAVDEQKKTLQQTEVKKKR